MSTIFEKEQEANTRLKKMSENPSADGILLYDMGNAFYELEEYPLAIFYYTRAQQILPYNIYLHGNLNQAQVKLGVKPTSLPLLPSQQYSLSLFFYLSVIALISWSIFFWKKIAILKRVSFISTGLASLFLFYATYLHYFSPEEGVVLHSTLLFSGTGKEYPLVSENPVLSGTKVKVVGVSSDGHWLKVISDNNETGYAESTAVRLL